MIIDKESRAGSYPAKEVIIDEDRRATVSWNALDQAFLATAHNGNKRATVCMTPEAAWALHGALGAALLEWGGEIGDIQTPTLACCMLLLEKAGFFQEQSDPRPCKGEV